MDHAEALPRSEMDQEIERQDIEGWALRHIHVPLSGFLTRYHRCDKTPLVLPQGPCVYVTHHGFGYLSLDVAMAVYMLAWQNLVEHGGDHAPVRTTIGISNLERIFPFLGTMRRQVGGIDPKHETMIAALKSGQQILMTPGGRRECQPTQTPYQLRWENRFGFVKTAIRAGVPILPFASVGGHEAYPGFKWGKLSFWSPVPLPARFQMALGDPIEVPNDPAAAQDAEVVQGLQQRVWHATQALYDKLLAERRGAR